MRTTDTTNRTLPSDNRKVCVYFNTNVTGHVEGSCLVYASVYECLNVARKLVLMGARSVLVYVNERPALEPNDHWHWFGYRDHHGFFIQHEVTS